MLFKLNGCRYERRSILIATNQPITAWDEIFPGNSLPKASSKRLTVTAVDRLVPHCHIGEICGDSHRHADADRRVGRRRKEPG